MISFIAFILSKRLIHKAFTGLFFAVFGYNLYVELFADPTHWTKWDMVGFGVVAANVTLVLIIMEFIKRKRHEQ